MECHDENDGDASDSIENRYPTTRAREPFRLGGRSQLW
jgi:hypothetical protein